MKLKIMALVLLLPVVINLLVFNSVDIVPGAQTIRVKEVSLSHGELVFDRLGTDASQRLTATVVPAQATNRKVNFVSSNSAVVTVDEHGEVTPVSNGITFITVTTEDGGHTATSRVVVQSFFIDKFEVTVDIERMNAGRYILEEGEKATISVIISPIEALAQQVPPFIHINNRNIDYTPFEVVDIVDSKGTVTFTSIITAHKTGLATLSVFVTELQTSHILNRTIEFEIWNQNDDAMKFMFEGELFDEQSRLVTIKSQIPLQVNIQTIDLHFWLPVQDDSGDPVAQIERDKDHFILIFNQAGTVTLFFSNEDETRSVVIESTFHKVNALSIKEILSEIGDLDLNLGMNAQILFNVNPSDFESYYRVNWSVSSDALTLMRLSATNVIITANRNLEYQWVSVQFIPIIPGSGESFTHRFNVGITNFGVDEIILELSNENAFIRGLERTYVFGNMNHEGDNFNLQLNFSIQGPPSATAAFDFSTQSDLAEVDNRGVVTFNSNYNFAENEQLYVTIRVRSLYPSLSGKFAEAQYTFIVVNGANVHDFFEYNRASQNNKNIVLHKNISFDIAFTTQVSVYGNGYTLDAHNITNTMNDPSIKIFTFLNQENLLGKNTTLITNVVFSGFADDDIPALANKGTLVTLHSHTTLQYSELLRTAILLYIAIDTQVSNSNQVAANENIFVHKNFLSYSGLAGALLGGSNNQGNTTKDIVFQDLIFENTFFGIVFAPEETTSNKGTFELALKGEIKFFSWHEVSLINTLSPSIASVSTPFGLLALTLDLSSFNFIDHLSTIAENGEVFVQFTILRLQASAFGQDFASSVVFEENTNANLKENFFESSFDGTIRAVGLEEGNDSNFSISTTAIVINPNEDSDAFISPDNQREHFRNPDYSLITRQVV